MIRSPCGVGGCGCGGDCSAVGCGGGGWVEGLGIVRVVVVEILIRHGTCSLGPDFSKFYPVFNLYSTRAC